MVTREYTAPLYRNTNGAVPEIVEAIRFVLADEPTHWHVNVGDQISVEQFSGGFWVRTATGPVEIFDGHWVVRHDAGLWVIADDEFCALFEAV